MGKNVFQAMEVVDLTNRKFAIDAPTFHNEEEEIEEVYDTSEIDALKLEAEEFRESWAVEKENIIAQANEEAERIQEEAKEFAQLEMEKITEEAKTLKKVAEQEIAELREKAEEDAKLIRTVATEDRDTVFAQIRAEAEKAGREIGWNEGMKEAKRLVERLHKIIDATIEKRRDIIDGAEIQLVNLVLLISRKVVKAISEKQKSIVLKNILHALQKLKSRGDVTIRVNLADLDLTTEHVKDFMRMVEGVKSITVLEDSTVDKGGAVIETDFGEVDARISNQLRRIEEKILMLAPLKQKGNI